MDMAKSCADPDQGVYSDADPAGTPRGQLRDNKLSLRHHATRIDREQGDEHVAYGSTNPCSTELTTPEATRPKTANPETKRGSVTRQPTTKAHTRGNSYASSTMSRSTTPASRAANGPFSSTVGPGSRPPSAMSRPQTSFNGRRPVGASIPRAASALDTHMEDTSPSVLGKRKGMRISSFLSQSNPPLLPWTRHPQIGRDL